MIKQAQNLNSQERGFTLIEAVVSAAVFAFVISSVVGVYLSTIQIDAKTRSERAVQQNARFISEFLGKEIRTGVIDYDSYTGGTISLDDGYTTELYLINQSDEEERVFCNGNNLSLTTVAGTTNLNSPEVIITDCKFFVQPTTTPFESLSETPPNQHPYVTMVLKLEANFGSRNINVAEMNVQTTYSVREYPSRQ